MPNARRIVFSELQEALVAEMQGKLRDDQLASGVFRVVSPYEPAGDQPKAIEALSEGIRNGLRYQTLLGVTGSVKTYTMAKTIEQVQKSTLVMAPNKTLAAQLASEFKEFFPDNAVVYFVSYYDYYQPEAYVPTTDTFIEKDASINEEVRSSVTLPLRLCYRVAMLSWWPVSSCIYAIGSPSKITPAWLSSWTKKVPMDRDALIHGLIRYPVRS